MKNIEVALYRKGLSFRKALWNSADIQFYAPAGGWKVATDTGFYCHIREFVVRCPLFSLSVLYGEK